MHRGSYDVWSAGVARKQLLPGTRTANPTAAASALLGKRRVARGKAALKRAGKKRRYRGNPDPAAIVSSLPIPGASIIGGLFKKSSLPARIAMNDHWYNLVVNRDPQYAQASANSLYNTGHATNRQPSYASTPNNVMKEQATDAAAKYDALVSQGHVDPASGKVKGAAAAPAGLGGTLTSILGTPGAPAAAAAIVRAVTRAPRRPRYPSYMDRYGRQRYSYKPPGSQMRLPVGATMAAGTPYNFFTGAVGKGGVGATAGQLAIAGAAGVGAYLVTQRLLQYLGGRAQSQEEAGVNAAKALHQSLEDYKKAHGQYPPPAERQAMKAAYQAKLVELGYDPVTFARTRGAVSDFLETYNPFGG